MEKFIKLYIDKLPQSDKQLLQWWLRCSLAELPAKIYKKYRAQQPGGELEVVIPLIPLSGKIEKFENVNNKPQQLKMKRKAVEIEEISYDLNNVNCDTIDWFVDILGTLSLLEKVIHKETGVKTPVIDVGKTSIKFYADKTGLYFKKGHWYSIKGGVISDSYSSDYQITGTAHFCQTFALLMYLDRTNDLVTIKDKYGSYNRDLASHNIKVAIEFWENYFKTHPQILKYFMREVKTAEDDKGNLEYYNRPVLFPDGSSVILGEFTGENLFEYMSIIKENADKFFNCKQG